MNKKDREYIESIYAHNIRSIQKQEYKRELTDIIYTSDWDSDWSDEFCNEGRFRDDTEKAREVKRLRMNWVADKLNEICEDRTGSKMMYELHKAAKVNHDMASYSSGDVRYYA